MTLLGFRHTFLFDASHCICCSTCAGPFLCVWVCVCLTTTCVQTNTHMSVHTNKQTRMPTFIHTSTRTPSHTHSRTYTHNNTHTVTHTPWHTPVFTRVRSCVRACVRAHTRVCVKWNLHKSWYYRSLDCVRIYIWPSDCMHIYEIIFTPYVTSICCVTHIYNMHAVCVHTNIRMNLCCPPPSGTQQRKAQDSLVTKEKNASNHSPK